MENNPKFRVARPAADVNWLDYFKQLLARAATDTSLFGNRTNKTHVSAVT